MPPLASANFWTTECLEGVAYMQHSFFLNLQVSYVLDTEDWFRRKRQKRGKGFDRQWRKEHFEVWLRDAAKGAALMQLSAASIMMQPTIENVQYPTPMAE